MEYLPQVKAHRFCQHVIESNWDEVVRILCQMRDEGKSFVDHVLFLDMHETYWGHDVFRIDEVKSKFGKSGENADGMVRFLEPKRAEGEVTTVCVSPDRFLVVMSFALKEVRA